MKNNQPITADDYINDFPDDIKELLSQMRHAITTAAPDATECISYGIITYKLGGNLVHFGGYKNHIGFYPGPGAINVFSNELLSYKTAKGSIQFPILKPLPLQLIAAITKLRVQENLEKMRSKVSKTKKA